MKFPKQNNFQWIRLALASQVMLEHLGAMLGAPIPAFIGHAPGVPGFFFTSGFLIYASYHNASGAPYYWNRFLRLFPALVVVTIGGVLVALYAHGVGDLARHPRTYLTWFVAQTTLGQAYNPALFRDIGVVGVINGSLWTITTEILFYASVPLIVACERRVRHTVLVLTALSFAVYAIGPDAWREPVYRDKTVYDVLSLTPIVWGWMFGVGILAVKHFEVIQRHMAMLPLALVAVVAMVWFGEGLWWRPYSNRLGLGYFVAYVALICWLAFATPYRPLKMDLSYGIYIWHMPIINLIMVAGITRHAALLAVAATVGLALFSWFAVERPALRLKRVSLLSPS